MAFFKSLFSFSPTNYPIKEGNSWFYPVGFLNNIFNGNQYLKDFIEVPEVNAVINLLARMEASWRLDVLSKATGEPAKNTDSIVKLLRNPNWFQSQSEYWKQSSIFRSIYGNEYLYFLTPIGFPNTYKAMFTLDPSKVEIKYTSENPYFLDATGDAIKYNYKLDDGQTIPLERSNIIHLNDNRVESENFLKGTSKLAALQAPIQNIREAYKKRNITLRMPVGIMSNGNAGDATGVAVPLDDTEKKELQTSLSIHGALPIMTGLAVNYDQMNINANSMGLFEEVREDTGRICDAFGIKYEQLASQKGVTFANLKEADKQVYESTVIPNAEERTTALNMHFEAKTWEITADYKHLAVFAEDIKQRSQSLNQMVQALSKAFADGALTIEQYKSELSKFGIE